MASNHAWANDVFPFLDLPKELRLMVYERLTARRTHRNVYTCKERQCHCADSHPDNENPTLTLVIVWLPTVLLRTCKFIRDEATGVLLITGPAYRRYYGFASPRIIVHTHERIPGGSWERSTNLAEATALLELAIECKARVLDRSAPPLRLTPGHCVLRNGARVLLTEHHIEWALQAERMFKHTLDKTDCTGTYLALSITPARRRQTKKGSFTFEPSKFVNSISSIDQGEGRWYDIIFVFLPPKLRFNAYLGTSIVEATGLQVSALDGHDIDEEDWETGWDERDLLK